MKHGGTERGTISQTRSVKLTRDVAPSSCGDGKAEIQDGKEKMTLTRAVDTIRWRWTVASRMHWGV